MSINKISPYEVKKILTFINSMKKTGKNVIKSLAFYGEKIAKDEKLKKIISSTVAELSIGAKLEDTLLKYGFLNNFQYAILKISTDKNKAFENILKFNKDKNEATIFYAKKLIFFCVIYVGIFFFLPIANEFFADIIEKITKTKPDYVMGTYVSIVLSLNDYYQFFAFVILGVCIFFAFFYKYSYESNLPLHYKLFKYKSMIDARHFFEIMVDLSKSELPTSKSLALLSLHAEPKSSRIFIQRIQKAVENKNIKDLEVQLRAFDINDFAIFTLVSSLEVGDLKNGFTSACENTIDYNTIELEKHKEIIDVISFFLNTLLIGGTALYFILLELEIGFS